MEVKNVVYSHDKKTNHVNHLSVDIELGKITTIIGPNGCGKSTLLGLLSNHYLPKEGIVKLENQLMQQYTLKEIAKRIAIVHQENIAPGDLTIERLVGYGRLPYRTMFKTDKEKDNAVITWALKETNLLEIKKERIDTLSGGQRQRVWIAMALAQQTPYLLLDEPTTYLDLYYQYEILELIKRLNQSYGLTIVMVLHDINQAIRYSDEIITMKHGKLIKKGSPETIITEELLQDIYDVDVLIKKESETGLYTIPIGI